MPAVTELPGTPGSAMVGTVPRVIFQAYLFTIPSRVPRNRSAYCVSCGLKHSATKHSMTKPLGRLLIVSFSLRHHFMSLTSGLNRPSLFLFISVVHSV